MKKPFAAYKGNDSFTFVCYAHSDAEYVYQDLILLNNAGCNIWYDEGISAGKLWREEIAMAIKSADKLVFFISKSSLASKHCLREVDYALEHDIDILPVYLDDSKLPEELALVFNRVQGLFRHKDAMYKEHLIGAMQSNTSFIPLLPKNTKSLRRFVLPLIAIGASLIALFIWNLDTTTSNHNEVGNSIAATNIANAYDNYLEATELMKRWDKDDNLDIAINLLEDAYTLDPNFALAYARSAEALRIRYILSADDSALEKATEAASKAVSLNSQLAPAQAALGLIYSTKGNMDLAIAAVERAIAIDPNDALTNSILAMVYAQLGRIEEADAAFQKATALDSDNPTVLNSYANFLYDQGRFDDAILQWRAALQLAPDHYAALVNLGLAFNETLRISEAIDMYQRAIDIRPSYIAYTNLGTAYSREARFQDAADAYLKALDIDDTDSLAWGNLAFIYSWMGNMDEKAAETFAHAIELAETIRQQHPRDPFIHSDLALYYAKTKQATLALQRLRTATILAPDSSEILSAAAEAYEMLGQRDEAVKLILLAIEHGHSREHLLLSPELKELVNDPRLQE
ncbi:tetratricopeptide repeat protein [Glaciecola sp. SC05]|uniref:tetratricopeptide repeat protein n=1 Tax=Glaciecola sp. SC05 TaxID=1987355 RepID=UPI0035283D95